MKARAAVLGALACLALPAPASADLVEFSGRTGKQSGKAWFPEAGFKGYHLSLTVNGAVRGCRGSGRHRRRTRASATRPIRASSARATGATSSTCAIATATPTVTGPTRAC